MILNDAGVIGLTLNGKSFPATEPIVMNEGEWGQITYYNEGLTAHPMHLHQFPQLVYAKDGIPLDEPYWADTINVAPGERYSVLFQADDRRHLGVPLPHPDPRRTARGHVRHGHRGDRQPRRGLADSAVQPVLPVDCCAERNGRRGFRVLGLGADDGEALGVDE